MTGTNHTTDPNINYNSVSPLVVLTLLQTLKLTLILKLTWTTLQLTLNRILNRNNKIDVQSLETDRKN